jgi:molybdenum cofactor cytidylyltransferase
VRLTDGTLRKGVTLRAMEIARLAAANVATVLVARLDPDDVAEDVAAQRVAAALSGVGIEAGSASTGRVNLHASCDGLLLLDAARIHAVNAVHEGLTVATLLPDAVVRAGQMIATIKIIPYAVPAAALGTVLAAASGAVAAIRVLHWRGITAGLVLTRTSETREPVLAKMRQSVLKRLEPLGATLVGEQVVAHDEQAVATALRQQLDAPVAPDVLLVSGAAATVDRADIVPAAIVRAGGRVLHAGMPVDPGNLLVLGELPRGQAVLPVVGIPTCARSSKLNGFDFVLRRLASGAGVTGADIMAMGVGGLLTEIESRPMPREPRRQG